MDKGIRKNRIIKRILKLYSEDKGLLNARTIMFADRAFMGRAERMFGSWKDAIEASGLDYGKIRKTEKWTKERIKSIIRMRWENKLELNMTAVQREYNPLLCAGSKYFGSWKKAIGAAGLKYSLIIKSQVGRSRGDDLKSWSEDAIKAEILRIFNDKGRLNSGYVQRNRSKLFYAAYEYFGGWKNAIESAGLDYSKIRRKAEPYTKERVIEKIREIAKREKAINYSAMDKKHSVILREALLKFGSWEEALKKSGISTVGVRLRKKWSKEIVIKELRKFKKKNGQIKSYQLLKKNHALYKAVLRHFGSFKNAMKIVKKTK